MKIIPTYWAIRLDKISPNLQFKGVCSNKIFERELLVNAVNFIEEAEKFNGNANEETNAYELAELFSRFEVSEYDDVELPNPFKEIYFELEFETVESRNKYLNRIKEFVKK